MEKEFVPYDRALKLKELGFDEKCFRLDGLGKVSYAEFGYGTTPIPTFSQAFRWFREKHHLHISIYPVANFSQDHYCWSVRLIIKQAKVYVDYGRFEGIGFVADTYEEAELACIDKLIEIVESKSE